MIADLEERLQSLEAFTRFRARAALMRRHLRGLNPMVSAGEEVKTFLENVGDEKDLDLDDELDGGDAVEDVAEGIDVAVVQEPEQQ